MGLRAGTCPNRSAEEKFLNTNAQEMFFFLLFPHWLRVDDNMFQCLHCERAWTELQSLDVHNEILIIVFSFSSKWSSLTRELVHAIFFFHHTILPY